MDSRQVPNYHEHMSCQLNADLAERFAQLALRNVATEYPHKLDHLINGPHELLTPRALHPAFYGAYDWHSAVHMHWTLARVLRLFPGMPSAGDIRSLFDSHLNTATIASELSYLDQPNRSSFERPYGWAWLLKLQAELRLLAAEKLDAQRWRDALQPLTEAFRERFISFVGKSDYPVRTGTHANSAFAMLIVHDYAALMQDRTLIHAISYKANQWFGKDHRYPAEYEPGGNDFLSGGLCEAALMARVVDGCSFFDWWQLFNPGELAISSWLTPVKISDRADPQIGHLEGLNLSRAWCWKMLAAHDDVTRTIPVDVITRAIDAYLDASLPYVTEGDFSATHWQASFALLALTGAEPIGSAAGDPMP